MTLEELKRSALMLAVELRQGLRGLESLDLETIPQTSVDQLFRDLDVKTRNLDQIFERIRSWPGKAPSFARPS